MDTEVTRTELPEAMEAFAHRNAGRRTWIEVDDPLIGAQEQGHGLPLMGIAYDRKDKRLQIMLGQFGGPGPHLTHTMGDIVRVDLVRDDCGRDVLLRVAQPEVQTLLRVEPRKLS